MTTLIAPTNGQRLLDAVAFEQLQRQRAAQTVRSRTTAGAARDELLACLGLAEESLPEA
jgi:hypothetical protein